MDGRFKHSGFLDEGTTGPVIRALFDGHTLARLLPSGRWSRPVREAREREKRWPDTVVPSWPAVQVQLDKGRYY